jgi:hypothetical protein
MNELSNKGGGIESTSTTKTVTYEDGSYDEIRVEKVEGGYIKTICKHYKDENGNWQYDTDKSVHTEDPLEEKMSLVDKLREAMKGV